MFFIIPFYKVFIPQPFGVRCFALSLHLEKKLTQKSKDIFSVHALFWRIQIHRLIVKENIAMLSRKSIYLSLQKSHLCPQKVTSNGLC